MIWPVRQTNNNHKIILNDHGLVYSLKLLERDEVKPHSLERDEAKPLCHGYDEISGPGTGLSPL